MFAPHAGKLAGDDFKRLLPIDGHKRLAAAALAARPPVLQPTRSHHWASDAKRRMHRVRDRLDQPRGVGIEVERDGADHLTVLYDGVERAPMGVAWNKLAFHHALVDAAAKLSTPDRQTPPKRPRGAKPVPSRRAPRPRSFRAHPDDIDKRRPRPGIWRCSERASALPFTAPSQHRTWRSP